MSKDKTSETDTGEFIIIRSDYEKLLAFKIDLKFHF